MAKALTELGFVHITSVETVADGFERLSTTKEPPIQLVLCDLYMPEVDGLAFIEQIRSQEKYKEVAVVMVSSESEMVKVSECLLAGADSFITKPFDSVSLRNVWENVWRRRKELGVSGQLKEQQAVVEALDATLEASYSTIRGLEMKCKEAVEAPMKALEKSLTGLQEFGNLSPHAQFLLSTIIQDLNASDIFRPAIYDIVSRESNHFHETTRAWLENCISNRPTPPTTPTPTCPGKCNLDWVENFFVDHPPHLSTPLLSEWDFEVLDHSEDALVGYIVEIFIASGIPLHFNIEEAQIRQFVLEVRSQYLSPPYHNFTHAFDVFQAMTVLLLQCGASHYFTMQEMFALLCATLLHDVDHPGVDSKFLIATGHEWAIQYHDQSVLENHHIEVGLDILSKCKLLEGLDVGEKRTFRTVFIEAILATDMSKHMDIIRKFVNLESPFHRCSETNRLAVMRLLMKAADISASVRKGHLAETWGKRIVEEFYQQGDKEKALGMKVSPFMDRDHPDMERVNYNFVVYLVIPLFSTLSTLLPALGSRVRMADVLAKQLEVKMISKG